VLDVRVDHGAQRVVLQVRELRHDERLRVSPAERAVCRARFQTAPTKGRRKPALFNSTSGSYPLNQ
jgi:hypothetical protein